MLRYLASLNAARQTLWCYLIWYLVVLVRYFDPRPGLWLTSLGLSGIIGVALWLSTAGTNAGTRLNRWHAGTRLDRWQIFRLFLMPFCVSSFAAMVKDRGFVLVFSPRVGEDALALGLCVAFLVAVRVARRVVGG